MTGTIEHGCWRWMEDGMIPMFPSQRATSSAGDDGSWKSVWALTQLSCDVVLGTYDTLWVGQWQFTIASYFAMNHNEHQGLWQIYIYVYMYICISSWKDRRPDTEDWTRNSGNRTRVKAASPSFNKPKYVSFLIDISDISDLSQYKPKEVRTTLQELAYNMFQSTLAGHSEDCKGNEGFRWSAWGTLKDPNSTHSSWSIPP